MRASMILEKKHKIRLPERKSFIPLAGVLIFFIISRILYDRAGIQFQGDTYLYYWQFIDPVLLRTDLWRSVFYLHSQPPLMNLFTGIIIQAFPTNHETVFHILYFITGLMLGISIYYLGIFLRFPPWISAVISTWFIISPGTALYEHWLTYAYPLTCALTLAGICVYQFIHTKKNYWGVMFFTLLGGIALTWSLFHLVWLIGIAVLLLVIFGERKKVVFAALVPVLLVTAWYAKNYFIAGEFTASTWSGMNVSRITISRLSKIERNHMIKSGQLSEFAGIVPFTWPVSYLTLLPDTQLTGIPILDGLETSSGNPNVHHLVYIEASKYYLQDALYIIRMKPEYYFRSVAQAFYIYFHPSSDTRLIQQNNVQVTKLDGWWKRFFSGQWKSDDNRQKNKSISGEYIGWWIVLGFFISITGSTVLLWKNRRHLSEPANFLILFMVYNILFLTLAGNFLEIGENNRFRFTIDPFMLILFIFYIIQAAEFVQKQRKNMIH